MNSIHPFQSESIDKLKLWLTNMSAKGHTKYYEIFVDTVRVVHKTDNPDYFDEYETWVDENTRSVRILIYNTQASHRSQVFEFRTNRFVDEISKDELLTASENKVQELLKRISDAEEYICKLESEQDELKAKSSGFDLEKIISFATPLLKQNSQLADNFGLAGFFNTPNKESEDKLGKSEASFKGKSNDGKIDPSIAKDEKTEIFKRMEESLNENQRRKVLEIIDFLIINPGFIDIASEVMKSQLGKDGNNLAA